MTTPSFVMPYGVTMQGKGDSVPEIVGEHKKKVNLVAIALPAGPCRIAASWDGPQTVAIRVYSGGRFRSMIAEIPSGGGVRSIMVSYGAVQGDWVQMHTSATATQDQRGTLEVYPLAAG